MNLDDWVSKGFDFCHQEIYSDLSIRFDPVLFHLKFNVSSKFVSGAKFYSAECCVIVWVSRGCWPSSKGYKRVKSNLCSGSDILRLPARFQGSCINATP